MRKLRCGCALMSLCGRYGDLFVAIISTGSSCDIQFLLTSDPFVLTGFVDCNVRRLTRKRKIGDCEPSLVLFKYIQTYFTRSMGYDTLIILRLSLCTVLSIPWLGWWNFDSRVWFYKLQTQYFVENESANKGI